MFGKKKSKQQHTTKNTMAKNTTQEVQSNTVNLIGSGTTIKGEVNSDGDIRIDGTLIGTINSKGKLVVGKSGKVDGEVNCKNADFSGDVKAKVNVTELLSLKASTKLRGDVVTSKLAVEPGAIFTGSCKMSNENEKPNVSTNFEPPKTSPKDKKSI